MMIEQDKGHQLTTNKMAIDLMLRGVEETARHLNDMLSSGRKEYDLLKRKMRGKRGMADAAKEVLPGLEQSLVDGEHSLRALADDVKEKGREVMHLRSEVSSSSSSSSSSNSE